VGNELDALESKVKSGRNYDSPPLHLWHPPLSGDIDIRIDANGEWYHEGTKIGREALVRLFASILRREDDGEYYLVTPGEKWRIEVELHPLMVIDFAQVGSDAGQVVTATLNTGRQVELGPEHPLSLDERVSEVAVVALDHGLSALCTRAAWYRLAALADDSSGAPGVISNGQRYSLLGES